MNQERRKAIGRIIEALERIEHGIDGVCYEEQEYFDNMPDTVQDKEANAVQKSINDLGWAREAVSEALGYLASIEVNNQGAKL